MSNCKIWYGIFLLAILLPCFGNAQAPDLSKGGYTIYTHVADTIGDRDKATSTLRALKTGAVVVRFKSSQRSVEAYINAGRKDVADRIVRENNVRDLKMMEAFKTRFTFCPVYFIKTQDTKRFLKGEKGLFLNNKLQYDSSIELTDSFFVFCEYGLIEGDGKYAGNSALAGYTKPERILDTVASQTSTSTYVHSALHFLDSELNQLRRPFPFGEQVVLDNYNLAVSFLNSELLKAYNRLVLNRDIQDQMKQDKKRRKELTKKK